jgi:tryptophan 2,3-dioxygenase
MSDFKTTSIDIGDESLEVSETNTYGGFLGLKQLLALQKPQWAGKHDEVMFIVVHQVSELWIKLLLHEIGHLRQLIAADDLDACDVVFDRVKEIQRQLVACWDVTVTLQPMRFIEFRETDRFQGSSGLQSHQYRILEFILGNKNPGLAKVYSYDPEIAAEVNAALLSPSLYDEVLALLQRHGLPVPADLLKRDWTQPYVASDAVEDVWLRIYREQDQHIGLHRLAESLVDIEYQFQKWRYVHMKTVERLIGFRRGTGGSGGVNYLVKALNITFFPELWSVRLRLAE